MQGELSANIGVNRAEVTCRYVDGDAVGVTSGDRGDALQLGTQEERMLKIGGDIPISGDKGISYIVSKYVSPSFRFPCMVARTSNVPCGTDATAGERRALSANSVKGIGISIRFVAETARPLALEKSGG